MDLELDKGLSRRFVDTFTLMLLLFAAADGVVSEAEAGFVNACADSMTAYCDRAGVKGGKSALDVQDFVYPGVPTGHPGWENGGPRPDGSGRCAGPGWGGSGEGGA